MPLTTALSSRRTVPLVAAVVMFLLGVNEGWFDPEFRVHFGEMVLGAAWIGTGFLVATRWPAAGVVAVSLFYPFTALLDAPGPGGTGLIAMLVAAAYAGYGAPRDRSLAAVGASVVIFVVTDFAQHGATWDTIFFPAVFFPAWWTGRLVRREQRRSQEMASLAAALDAQREAAAHAAVTEERARIAREVHDSVAHSVSVMTLQIGGLRRQLEPVLTERPTERDVMLGLERLGRQSVEELRAAVGVLREASGQDTSFTAPSLRNASDLVEDVAAAGLDVRLQVEGDLAALPKGLDVAAYRVVQEALTNALRHAPGASVDVAVVATPERLTVEVTDDGARTAAPAPEPVGGHGLVGMSERTSMYGGTLEAGPRADAPRGFRVRATLPIGTEWR
jgi:signal transduction histidine kinase